MNFIYNIIVYTAGFIIKPIALFNSKINLFVNGRKEIVAKLSQIKATDKVIWIHSASLGEFEQARPIIEQIKKEYSSYKIVVTFFSPSGYEIRKNYNLADLVCYLPLDTKQNVRKFIKQVHPDLAIIVKYEFWPNLLNELKITNTKTILVSGIFRKDQLFFKSYGSWIRKSLEAFSHFFVQNTESKDLLNSVGFTNVTISGDTRFDRVSKILEQDNALNFISDFKNNNYTVVAGSTWIADEKLLVKYINNEASSDEKFIIAPHNIHQKEIHELKNSIKKKTVLFSEKEDKNLAEYQVFIIDTIGILTKIYAYADLAYVGGGLETGLHNILEPATFGVPIVFGANKYHKFQEAVDLITLGGCKAVKNQQEFSSFFKRVYLQPDLREKIGRINKEYVQNNIGATDLVLSYINKQL